VSSSKDQLDIKISPAEICFGRELKLPIDLLRGTPPQERKSEENIYVSELRRKLNALHARVKQQINLKSRKVKALYNRSDDYFLKKAKEFDCLILKEIKGRLLSYRVIGKNLMRLLED